VLKQKQYNPCGSTHTHTHTHTSVLKDKNYMRGGNSHEN